MTECKTCDDVARQIKCDEKCQKELKDIWNAPQYMFNNTTYDHNTIWATGYRNILAIQSRDRRRIGARTEKLQESMYHSEERNFSDMSHGWQSSCASDLIKRIDLIVSINKYKTRLKWFVSDETIIDQCEFSCYRRNKSANDKFDYKQIGKYRIDSPDFDFWLRNPKSNKQLGHKLQLGDQQIDYSPNIGGIIEKRIYHTCETYYARTLLLEWWININCKLHEVEDEKAMIAYKHPDSYKWKTSLYESLKPVREYLSNIHKIAMIRHYMDRDYAVPMLEMYESYKERVAHTDEYIRKQGFCNSKTYSSVLLKREIKNSGILEDLIKRAKAPSANIISPDNKKSGFLSWFSHPIKS